MASAKTMDFGLIIPVLNAEPHLASLLPALRVQSARPTRFLVMDSQSNDAGAEKFRAAGAEIVTVNRDEFDHGGTRQRAAELLSDCEVLIYLTQDAIPATPESFARLLAAFADPKVGMAYGRQLPHKDASPIAAHARLFNYPPESCAVRFESRHEMGVKTYFCSDSFCAYRSAALAQVGGFPDGAPIGEDVLVAAMMLRDGWIKQYVAEAQVYHSHSYGGLGEFRRAFDIGAFYSTVPWLDETFGAAGGEGRRFVMSELRYLAKHAPILILAALPRTALKAAGYSLGRRNKLFPPYLKRYLSRHRDYWSCQDAR